VIFICKSRLSLLTLTMPLV